MIAWQLMPNVPLFLYSIRSEVAYALLPFTFFTVVLFSCGFGILPVCMTLLCYLVRDDVRACLIGGAGADDASLRTSPTALFCVMRFLTRRIGIGTSLYAIL